jgi:hypothetical protein
MSTLLPLPHAASARIPGRMDPSGGELLRSLDPGAAPPSGSQWLLTAAVQGGLIAGIMALSPIGAAPLAATARTTEFSRSAVLVRFRREDEQTESPYVASHAADEIATVQDVFGLTLSDLSRILRVSRPTLYAWLEGTRPSVRAREASGRLAELHRWAVDWRSVGAGRATALLGVPLETNRSLLDLWSTPGWDVPAIERALETLRHRASGNQDRAAWVATAPARETTLRTLQRAHRLPH